MQNRAVIEKLYPQLENGYNIKRALGELVQVKANVFADGHDFVNAQVKYKTKSQKNWSYASMKATQNDEWVGEFKIETNSAYLFTVIGFIDKAYDWLLGIRKKKAAMVEIGVELMIGVQLLKSVEKISKGDAKKRIKWYIEQLDQPQDTSFDFLNNQELEQLIIDNPVKEFVTEYEHTQTVEIVPAIAEFSNWYEFFPRSASAIAGQHGTFAHCQELLPTIAAQGFSVLYFPPIHPIGVNHRKGKNNAVVALPHEPGSPWAIGAADGGHKAIHKQLGTLKEFKQLVKSARDLGIEIAMDIAFQASQDHPYVKENPQWFKWRPDGTVQYAENPPKKYQDVLPFYFETEDHKALWIELKSVFEYWINAGVKIFRVDNPHTKPFVFWQWCIAEIKKKNSDIVFLSEAFTRPKIMARLAKIGFSQSYTYFTWRTQKHEIIEYINELTNTELREYFRPNFWPNTPDILPYQLQNQGYSIAAIRFVLAATLSSNYGMYGPVYELLETEPNPGKEEYFNSEKYEIRHWDWTTKTPLRNLIKEVNQIRNNYKALQTTYNIEFCTIDNNQILCFVKKDIELGKHLYIVVNLDPNFKQSGFCFLPYQSLGIKEGMAVKIKDLLTNELYIWDKEWNYVELVPEQRVCHIFEIEQA
jgi:starch synthase (maltosyl-transferring)